MKEKPFNDAFAALKQLKAEKDEKAAGGKTAGKRATGTRAPHPDPLPAGEGKGGKRGAEDEAALFLAAVGEVAPVRGPARVDTPRPIPAVRIPSEEDEVLTQLSELVAGEGPFDLADSDEYLEGSIAGLDRRIVQKLRRGEYALQAHLDLHGLTRAEAKAALEPFLLKARHEGRRCVLIVHGRGLHSKDQLPVLKESVQTWLSRGRLSKVVLAFTSARPADGGVGAVYVLLRR